MNDETKASSFRDAAKGKPSRARSSPLGPGGRDEAPRIVVNVANRSCHSGNTIGQGLKQKAAHWFAKRVREPPTAATTAAWSPADRSSPKREFGRTARPAGPDIGIPGRDRPARAGARLSSLSIRDRRTVNASRALSKSPEISTLDRHPERRPLQPLRVWGASHA